MGWHHRWASAPWAGSISMLYGHLNSRGQRLDLAVPNKRASVPSRASNSGRAWHGGYGGRQGRLEIRRSTKQASTCAPV